MNDDLRKKYRTQLAEAHLFLNSDTRSSPRKTWTPSQRLKWLMRQKECPTCKIELTTENLTKEHIHPLCLGGLERDDNVIAMCNDCNRCRNEIMTAVLGGSDVKSFRSRWPANKTSIEEFIVWCCATVYNDTRSVSLLSHIDDKFRKCRGLRQNKLIESNSSMQTEIKSERSSNLQTAVNRIRNMTSNLFEKLASTKTNGVQEEVIDCGNCQSKLAIPVGYSGKIKCKACETIFSNVEDVAELPAKRKAKTSVEPKGQITQQKTTNEASKEPTPVKSPADGDFPVYSNVNTSRGLRLPRNPIEMLYTIAWVFTNDLNYENWDECKSDFLSQGIITEKSRAVRVLIHAIMWYPSYGDKYGNSDFKNLRREIDTLQLFELIDKIQSECLEKFSMNETAKENILIYFDEVRKLGKEPIKDFNTSGRGLKLPHNPKILHSVILWCQKNVKRINTYDELKEALKVENLISNSRIRYVLSFILRSFEQGSENKSTIDELYSSIKVDFSAMDISLLSDLMYEKSKNYDKLDFNPKELPRIKYYFQQVSIF